MVFVLIVIVVGVAAVVVFQLVGKPGSATVAAHQPQATPKPEPRKFEEPLQRFLLVNPDWTFEKIERAMAQCECAPDRRDDGPEPASAFWRCHDVTIMYRGDPELGFRGLHLAGPPDQLRGVVNDLVNGAYLSTMETRLTEFLDAGGTSKRLRYGLRGAEWIGKGADHKFYWEKVGALREHPDAAVAAEAQRVYDLLIVEANGKPIPSGPRGLPLDFGRGDGKYALVAVHRGTRFQLVEAAPGWVLYINDKEHGPIDAWPDSWTRATG